MRLITRAVKPLAAAAVLIAVLVGPPWALLRFLGNPWPAEGVSWSAPLTDNAIIGLLAVVVWVLWAQLAVCILVEAAAALTDDQVHLRVPFALPVQQHLARRLVAALAVVAVTGPIGAGAAYATTGGPVPAPSGSTTSRSTAATSARSDAVPPAASTAAPTHATAGHAVAPATPASARHQKVTVMRLDSLWSIADRVLGNGERWPLIAELNEGRVMNDGTRFTSANHIEPGWELRVPAQAGQPVHEGAGADSAAHTVTVHEGDTLSQIAEDQLGDATAYPAIFHASRHLTQPDGRHLTDPDSIDVGWTLQIPTHTPSSTSGPTSHPDSGHDGERSHEPTSHSSHHDQPSTHQGHGLSSQPTDQPTTQPASQPTAQPTQVPNPSEQTSANGPAPEPAGTATAADTASDSDLESEVIAATWLLGGLTGGGALLAGALLLGLQRRRRAQFRARRPGRAIVAPPPEAAPAEMTANAAGAPAALTVDFIHGVLRRLAENARARSGVMPPVAAVEVTSATLTLHLSGPADFDAPWQPTPDRLHWHCPTDTPLDAIGPDASWVEPPYPMLVTIGHCQDDDMSCPDPAPSVGETAGSCDDRAVADALPGGVWLLNLEELGATRVVGDPGRVADFVRHLAAQLAVNPWAERVGLDLVGIAEETQALGENIVGEKVACHQPGSASAAEALAAATQLALSTLDRATDRDVDLATGRAVDADGDVWPARAVVVLAVDTAVAAAAAAETDTPTATTSGGEDTLAGVGRLVELVAGHTGRTGAAVVIAGDGAPEVSTAATLRVTDRGRVVLDRQGLDLAAVGLTSAEAQGCAQLYAYADVPQDVEVPVDEEARDGWESYCDRAGAIRREHTLPRSTPPNEIPEPVSTVLQGEDDEYVEVAPATAEDLEAIAPMVPDRVRDEVERADPDLDADLADWANPLSPRPKLTLLGPVHLRTHGEPLAKYRAVCTEVVAYLALRPRTGATGEELLEAMGWTEPARVRNVFERARRWLGNDPVSGEPYLPHANRSQARKIRGVNVYEVCGVLSDLDLFRRLRARGRQEDLVQALQLVTGRPFSQLRSRGWSWLLEGERHDLYLTAAIADVAFTVVTHCLQEGDVAGAREAAEIAMLAVPEEQVVQLCQVAVTQAEGNQDEAMRLLIEICNWAEPGDLPDDLPERTQQIIRNHRWLAS